MHDLGITMCLAQCCLADQRGNPDPPLAHEVLPGERELGVVMERWAACRARLDVLRCLEQVRYVLRVVDEDVRSGLFQGEVLAIRAWEGIAVAPRPAAAALPAAIFSTMS